MVYHILCFTFYELFYDCYPSIKLLFFFILSPRYFEKKIYYNGFYYKRNKIMVWKIYLLFSMKNRRIFSTNEKVNGHLFGPITNLDLKKKKLAVKSLDLRSPDWKPHETSQKPRKSTFSTPSKQK
uniref:Uncharacterized protein n=1 Tax=Cacopsylla melanoneura TaxID=428564 RepID=A0A8D8ZAE8_9HEMI